MPMTAPATARSTPMTSRARRASAATAKAGDEIDEAPLIALAGGLAVGVLLAAFLPRTEREDKLLGPSASRSPAALADRGRCRQGCRTRQARTNST